ncbi:ArnT family glycosyltransferase [Caulobacter sp. KR2-114]|uniref:ArnT family glycosyltransferase n=1 Tax=Caulobacter sp. KR2-114 TaxID=3400912 RepID=UPI003C019C07
MFLSPLELYPDEAQYWLWSRSLAFGYFSKPPLVAWIIAASTALGRDTEPFVRLASPLLHAAAALAIGRAGLRMQGGWAGAAAGALYSLSPGVALSAFVVSTDAPLLLSVSLALWAYVWLQQAVGRERLSAAAALGAALGLAMLAKYAALFAVAGVLLHAAISPQARRAWSPATAGVAIVAFLLLIGPNLAWNLGHGFATVAHTASNADWAGRRFQIVPVLTFLAAQFGVFGPIPFALLLGAGIWLAARRRLTAQDQLLLCFVLPPLLAIAGQAFVSRANANWAAAAYPAASVLVGGWLARWRARRLAAVTLGSQALIAVAIAIGLAAPAVADKAGAANSLKRLRGWRATTQAITQRADLEGLNAPADGGLTAVAVDDRFLFNEAAYYGRGYFGRAGPPLTMWVRGAAPQNQAELTAPLTAAQGRRVLAVSLEGRNTAAMSADFASASDRQINQMSLDLKHWRSITSFIGAGFAPKPRPAR